MKIIRSFGRFEKNAINIDERSCLILDLNTMRFTVQPIRVLKSLLVKYKDTLIATNLKVLRANNKVKLIQSSSDEDDRLGFIYTNFSEHAILSQMDALEPLLVVIAMSRRALQLFNGKDGLDREFIVQNIDQPYPSSRIKLASSILLKPSFYIGNSMYRLKITYYGLVTENNIMRSTSRVEFSLTKENVRKANIQFAHKIMLGRNDGNPDISRRANMAYERLKLYNSESMLKVAYDLRTHFNPFEDNDFLEIEHTIIQYATVLAGERVNWR